MPQETGPKSRELPPVFEIDISSGWDTVSQKEVFINALKKLPFYKPGLLYSGFNAEDIGITSSSKEMSGVIFAETEKALNEEKGSVINNPWNFAMENEHPAFAIYDPLYLQETTIKDSREEVEVSLGDAFRATDQRALVAIIKIKI